MSLDSKIISLNIGSPQKMEWEGKQVLSSMLKHPVDGPLNVHLNFIEGNSFANAKHHGAIHNVLYAYGMISANEYAKRLGLTQYVPGSTGETLTLDALDETDVSVGDVFQIGEVTAQATSPRIPCGKVNIRMQNPLGQKAMIDCGRSGVYFRILKPGLIQKSDVVRRTKRSPFPFTISRLYELMTSDKVMTEEELKTAKQNPAFPESLISAWGN